MNDNSESDKTGKELRPFKSALRVLQKSHKDKRRLLLTDFVFLQVFCHDRWGIPVLPVKMWTLHELQQSVGLPWNIRPHPPVCGYF